jgi:4'-phosphopantetheinyl transferase
MATQWQNLNQIPKIGSNELHIWAAFLAANPLPREYYLAEDERQRMQRFRFEHDRLMYGFAQGLLRILLAGYLDLSPRDIDYSRTEYGKPYLYLPGGDAGLEFNLSHSGDAVLIAITRGVPVGVDVEQVKPLPDLDQVASNYFSAAEQVDLFSLTGSTRVDAFYRCWTRKEALIKASGEGLSMPLDSFQVSLLPGAPPELVQSANSSTWMLLNIEPAPGYAAAAAAPVKRLKASFFAADQLVLA